MSEMQGIEKPLPYTFFYNPACPYKDAACRNGSCLNCRRDPDQPLAWAPVENEGRAALTAHALPAGQKIYISGPMRGHDDLNFPAFDAVTELFTANGWFVHSPAENDRQKDLINAPYSVCIRDDINFLLDSHAICLLPGWRASEGARFEVSVALALDLKFYSAEPGYDGEWIYREIDNPSTEAEGIDQEARRLVYGNRAATYGHPRGDFKIIAQIWSGILDPILKDDSAVTEEQVALCMSGLKLARLAKSPEHRDSQVDTIGYMLCLARLQEDPAEVAAWERIAAE